MTEQEQGLAKVERKWLVPGSGALPALHCAFAKVVEGCKRREKFEDSKERLGVAQIATSKARENSKVVREEASMFEADCVAEVGRKQNTLGELTKQ